MLNNIILASIAKDQSKLNAMQSDPFEDPKTYTGWFYPVRYLLSLRYLKTKQKVLSEFRQDKTYPISDNDFKQALLECLSPKQKKNKLNNIIDSKAVQKPVFSSILKAGIIYPLMLIALAVCIYSGNKWYQQKQMENVLANYLPYYSDLLHRKLLLKHNNMPPKHLVEMDKNIASIQEKIISHLPQQYGIQALVSTQLDQLKDPALDSEKIMLGFKAVNTLFDKHKLPYYLNPKSFTMPCSSLIDAPVEQMMMLKKLEALMSNNNPELCRTTMMTTYKVDDRSQLFYADKQQAEKPKVELPLFHVHRIDKVPAVDGALGLTFKDRGIGSIILVDRIKHFAQESILPALTFQGRNYIIPYWMQGYYEIEEAVTKAYKKDINQIYPDKKEQREVKTLVKRLIRDKNRMQNSKMQQTMSRTNSNNDKNIFGNGFDAISVLLGKNRSKQGKNNKEFLRTEFDNKDSKILQKLDNVLFPSIEYHEAYHQIDKRSWGKPTWLKTTFKDKLSKNATEHMLEELGAYLSQIANTDQAQKVWLSKLLIFSLNPMTKGQAEYYASSIIFNAFEDLELNLPVKASYIATVEDKTKIFKMLLEKDTKEISHLARRAYLILFQRDVPTLVN